jgi:DNA-binding response OmpR family regulator
MPPGPATSAGPRRTETWGGVAVWESSPDWAPDLIRALQPAGLRVHSCRTLADVWNAVQPGQPWVAWLDAECGMAALLEWLRCHRPLRPMVPVLVHGRHVTEELEWGLREAGVQGVLPSGITISAAAAVCTAWLRNPHQEPDLLRAARQ